MNRSIKVAREERNRIALSRTLNGTASPAAPARPKAKPKFKPKVDTKGGGKGKTDAEKKKTLCAYFAQGYCNKGKDCKYEHDKTKVPAAPA